MPSQPQQAVAISKDAYRSLIDYCLNERPFEACGLLACNEGSQTIDFVRPIRNTHKEPLDSFSFDPEDWTSAFFAMQKNRQRLVGLFHSHPRTEAIPSIRDKTSWPHESDLYYWIVSLLHENEPQVGVYCFQNNTFERLTLMLA
ncbi:Mov34/MPN/PAD-1 family protein [Paenibacillus sp. GCM10027627]|uniref:Mov34/MPN/PAD-1 family protein n=1 Tax=unclassified Paenibacillus TaxID=185978 RepID=UPI00363DD984